MAGLTFAVLGPVRAERDGAPLELGSPQQRAVLAVLLFRPGQPASIAEIVDAVWGEAPPKAAVGAARTYVSRLRRLFEPEHAARGRSEVLPRVGDGYRIRIDPDALDLTVFHRLRTEGERARRAGDAELARQRLARALDLWQGTPLAGLPGPFARLQRDRLAELRLATLESRIDLDLERGGHAEVCAELSTLCADHPLRERIRAQLMLALYRSGRQAEALALYADTRRLLADELGVEPGEPLRALHMRILRNDPTLATPRETVRVAPPRPAQLPTATKDFTGRAAQVAELVEFLSDERGGPGVRAVALTGIGGVGKTALAVHVAHAVRAGFPDGQLYADLSGTDASTVLGGFLRALGVADGEVPERLAERTALFRSIVDGRRLLMLLDNACDTEQLRWLMPGSAGCAVLVTCRRRAVAVPLARLVEVDLPDHREALDLLARIAGPERVAADPAAADELVALCGRLPLALRIVASRLAINRRWTLAELAGSLADERRRLEGLCAGDLSVEAAFELSYRRLTEPEARAFRLLAVPRGPVVSVPLAAAVLDRPERATERLVESLVDKAMLESPAPGRYRYHDLLRIFARERVNDVEESEMEGATLRLLDYLLATARNALRLTEPGSLAPDQVGPTVSAGTTFPDAERARAWLLAERATILDSIAASVRTAGSRPDLSADLLLMTMRLADFGHGWQELDRVAHAVAEEARRRGDQRSAGRARYVRARVLHQLHRHDEAAEQLRLATRECSASNDSRMLAQVSGLLGIVHYEQGRLAEAVRCYDETLRIERETNDVQGMAITLANLAGVHREQHRPDDAVELCVRGRALAIQAGDGVALTITTYALGRSLLAAGRAAQARAHFADALDLAERYGLRRWQGQVHALLARACREAEDPRSAIHHAERAIALGRETGHVDSECDALTALGYVLGDRGQWVRAGAAWQRAYRLSRNWSSWRVEELRAALATLDERSTPAQACTS